MLLTVPTPAPNGGGTDLGCHFTEKGRRGERIEYRSSVEMNWTTIVIIVAAVVVVVLGIMAYQQRRR